jgi:hypothetical protein
MILGWPRCQIDTELDLAGSQDQLSPMLPTLLKTWKGDAPIAFLLTDKFSDYPAIRAAIGDRMKESVSGWLNKAVSVRSTKYSVLHSNSLKRYY